MVSASKIYIYILIKLVQKEDDVVSGYHHGVYTYIPQLHKNVGFCRKYDITSTVRWWADRMGGPPTRGGSEGGSSHGHDGVS